MTISFVFTLIITVAFAEEPACWLRETNPYAQKPYSSETEWQMHASVWEQKQPPAPSLWTLFWAHQTYKKTMPVTETFTSDKQKHCYVGCELAQNHSLNVADYVGWLKESEDLSDCNASTYFEPLDYVSTLDGAQLGLELKDEKTCAKDCFDYEAPSQRQPLSEL